MMNPKTFEEIERIARRLVRAESLPAWEKHEQVAIDKARKDALECMRIIGSGVNLEKIGKEDDWGT